jgi:DNA-binding NarL/FixJ family response regulator
VARLLSREAAHRQLAGTLTARELAIAGLVAQGLRNKQIGAQLAITEGTVKLHLHSVYQKLGVTSRVELANRLREISAERHET